MEQAMLEVPLTVEQWADIMTIICPEEYTENKGATPLGPKYKIIRRTVKSAKQSYTLALRSNKEIAEDAGGWMPSWDAE